jgi:hypothetical protein
MKPFTVTFIILACLALFSYGATYAFSVHKSARSGAFMTTTQLTETGYCQYPNIPAKNHDLVPGIPCEMTLFRYSGLSGGIRLVGSIRLHDHAVLRRLTSAFNALRSPGNGNYNCPDDNGSKIVAILKYQYQSLRLTFDLSGCATVRRGDVIRLALGHAGARLAVQLERLIARR